MAILRAIHPAPLALSVTLALVACGSTGESSAPPPVGVNAGDASIAVAADGGLGGGGGGGGGAAGGDASSGPAVDPLAEKREACTFPAGSSSETTLGVTAAARAKMPIEHVIVVMRENRSFDQYFGSLSRFGQPDVAPWPANYANPDGKGEMIKPSHQTNTCFASDPGHQWNEMRTQWNNGKMDGFVQNGAKTALGSDGHFTLGYYEPTELPFYYYLANTYAIADRYFSSVLSGTFANRDYLVLGSSYGVKNTITDGFPPQSARSVFDELDEKGITWGVYTDSFPLEFSLGWFSNHKGCAKFGDFIAKLADGTLPAVSFVDSRENVDDEHPPADIQRGETWTKSIYDAAIKSPLWAKTAIFLTWDESGGFFDHVSPPKACIPSPDQAEFDQLGIRVPLVVISPWAKKHFVSHVTHQHTSILRFIQARFDLPALTARDANSDALLDMFDFDGSPTLLPATPPAAGTGGCAK